MSNLLSARKHSKTVPLFFFHRGDHIVPNFNEIWPSGKTKTDKRFPKQPEPQRGMKYFQHAMAVGIPGERDEVFTTVGKPKVNTQLWNILVEFFLQQVQWNLAVNDIPNGTWIKEILRDTNPFVIRKVPLYHVTYS